MITDERRPVEGFPHYLITRNGTIYSPQGRELFRTDDVERSKVELRLPGDAPTWPCPPARQRTSGRHAWFLVRQLRDKFGPFTGDGAALMQACPELYGPN